MNIYIGTYLKIYQSKTVKYDVYTLVCPACNKHFRKQLIIPKNINFCGECGGKYIVEKSMREVEEKSVFDIFGDNNDLITIGVAIPYVYVGGNLELGACLFNGRAELMSGLSEISTLSITQTRTNFYDMYSREIHFLIENKRDFEIITGILTI